MFIAPTFIQADVPSKRRRSRFANGVHWLRHLRLDPVATAPGSVSTSVLNSHAKAAAVVAIVIIVDSQNQTTINRNSSAELTAD